MTMVQCGLAPSLAEADPAPRCRVQHINFIYQVLTLPAVATSDYLPADEQDT